MSTLREIQMCSFEILKEVVRVCEKHNLTYFLGYGTLLGAVRHKGFIPWDDDIDIEMPLKDYRKFLKIAPKEISKDFFIQSHKSDPAYNLFWTHVRANNTTSMPIKQRDWNIHFGMHIDIFPLVGVCRGKLSRKLQTKGLQIARTLISKDYIQACEPNSLATNTKLKILYKLPYFVRKFLCDTILRIVLKDPFKSKICSALEIGFSCNLDPSVYNENTMVEFEGSSFVAPKNYDYVLTAIYGDYMTPPPENERFWGHEGTHGKIIYDHTKDFSVYKNLD